MNKLGKKHKQLQIAREWWKGGTLHQGTLADWQAATYGNGLATAADWVSTLSKRPNVTLTFSQTLRPHGVLNPEAFLSACLQLVTAITESSRDQPKSWYMRTSELALIAAYALGWLDDTQNTRSDLPDGLKQGMSEAIQKALSDPTAVPDY